MGDHKKLFLTPYFGEFPNWWDYYLKNIESLKQYGYEFLIDTDLQKFEQRVGDKLGITLPLLTGTRKLSDLRPALALLYADEVKGYEFWGHTDFDCVYGRVDHFIDDAALSNLDIHSNHHCYMCGPWSLYRNTETINNLFREWPRWQWQMSDEAPLGWVEREFSQIIDQRHEDGWLRRRYTYWQAKDPNDDTQITMRDGALYDGGTEIFMHHFNRLKRWPPCLIASSPISKTE